MLISNSSIAYKTLIIIHLAKFREGKIILNEVSAIKNHLRSYKFIYRKIELDLIYLYFLILILILI